MVNRDSALEISDTVVEEIRELHGRIKGYSNQAAEDAIRIGEILTAVKGVRRGNWIEWIESNLPFGVRQAQRYLSIYDRRDQIRRDVTSHLGSPIIVSIMGNSNGQQQLHESDFWIRNSKLGQTWFGAINHELKDRPLEKWRRDQWIDLASTLAPFAELYAKLKSLIG